MKAVSLKVHGVIFLIASLLAVLYITQLVQRAHVTLELETSRKTIFKVYWPTDRGVYTEKRMSQIVIRPGQTKYTLWTCNLGSVDHLRIDTSEKPAQLILKSIEIRQPGYQPLILSSPEELAGLVPIAGIEAVSNGPDGLVVIPATGDPQLVYTLPALEYHFPYFAEGVRIAVLFLLVYAVAFASISLWSDFSYITVLMVFIFALILVMAGISKYNKHPDEFVHVAAATYYQEHSLPPKICDPAILHTYSDYGVSRLHSGEIVYLIVGKFMQLVRPLHLQAYQSFRYFNVLLFFLLVLLSMHALRSRPLLLPFLISPQIWYIFSYANSDAFALVILTLIACQVCLRNSWFNRITRNGIVRQTFFPLLLLGFLVGLSLLVKMNFYFFHVFLVAYLVWRAYFTEIQKKVFLKRCLLIGCIGLAFAGTWRSADYLVNGLDRGEKLLQCREQLATPIYNPKTPLNKRHIYLQMKERGTTLQRFLDVERWGEKSFRSSFGVYGYTSISGSFAYYDLVRFVGLLVLCVFIGILVLRGGISGISLLLITAGVAVGLIVTAMYHAWTVDFQAQGRYFLPIAAMLSVLICQTERCFRHSFFQLLVLVMFLFSTYNFIYVGLYEIAKFGG